MNFPLGAVKMNDLMLSAPLWSLFLFSLIPLSIKLLNRNKEYSPFISSSFVLAGIFTSFFLIILKGSVLDETTYKFFSSALVLDQHRALASLLLLIAGAFVIVMSIHHPQENEKNFSEGLFLKTGALIGLMILLWSNNLLTAFIGLEMASLTFYLLIALSRSGPEALKASFKYFVLGSVAGAILLYGISFVLASVGHFDLKAALQKTPELIYHSRLLVLGLVLILVGFLFKIAIFPFHFWLPEVYRGSSTSLLVFMAVGFKVVVFVLLFDWIKNIFAKGHLLGLLSLFQWMAVLSVLFGNVVALLQKDFKKMLLFSTVAHSGYLFMILISFSVGFQTGQEALFYYLIVYVCMTIGVFICLRPFEKPGSPDLDLENLKGLAYKHPIYAGLITLFLLSLAGIPPTGGFIAKLFLFHSLLDQGFWWMLFWTILGSTIALFYYLRPIALMYMGSEIEGKKSFFFPSFLKPVLWFLTAVILLTGLAPSLFNFIFTI